MVGGAGMQVEEDLRVLVYEMKNDTFENIGELNQIESLMWPEQYAGYASFKLTAPITEENTMYLKEKRVLWKVGGTSAAVIEIINSSTDEDGQQIYEIKGRTLECLLAKRIVWNTYFTNSSTVPKIIEDLVRINCVSPSESSRKIPYLTIEPYIDSDADTKITYQKTGGTVYDAVSELAQDSNLGFEIQFVADLEALIFRVYKGTDRTINQSKVDAVIFSSDTDDILSSSYNKNISDYKNVALIAGEGEGSSRIYMDIVHSILDPSGKYVLPEGFDRDELFVDARDLQSTYTDDSGEKVTLSSKEYLDTLSQRGEERLSENSTVENFECNLRTAGVQFEYGKDYFLGDIVTVIDTVLGVTVDAHITAVEDDYSDTHQKIFTFGYGYPSLLQKIKTLVS